MSFKNTTIWYNTVKEGDSEAPFVSSKLVIYINMLASLRRKKLGSNGGFPLQVALFPLHKTIGTQYLFVLR